MSSRRHASAAVALSLAGLSGCGALPDLKPIPMDQIYDDGACPATLAPLLLVFLPGANMAPRELVDEGFVAAVRRRRLAVDLVLPDANLGYVRDRSVLGRLHDEVIAPARARGYRRIWLAGISLGGYLALLYAQRHPGEVEGIVALAPYLGRDALLQEIADAGGARAWRRREPDAQTAADDDVDRSLWRWLAAPPSGAPPLWLGYGSEDRLVAGHRLLAALLLPGQVDVQPGRHDWPPWRTLWSQWLDRATWPTGCAA